MHAVSAYSDSLRQEVAGSGVSVSVIYPAVTATDLFTGLRLSQIPPAFRYITPMHPDKVARAVVSAVRRGKNRVILPRIIRLLLVASAVSSRLGDLIVTAIGTRLFARVLGLSSGSTLPDVLANPKAAER